MINFFRKIRKKLADDNKPLKYMRYAVGEIVLVVIGILIALSINNWNELRKSKNLEKEYLVRFLDDLNTDMIYYQSQIARIDELLVDYSKFIEDAYQHQNSLEEFLKLIKYVDFPPGELTINDATYTEIVNAGNLNIFRNPELKSGIINLYRSFHQLNKHIKDYDGVTSRNLGDLNQELKILKSLGMHRDNLPWNKDHMFENIKWDYINRPSSEDFLLLEQGIGLFYNKHKMAKRYIEDLVSETSELVELIKDELN